MRLQDLTRPDLILPGVKALDGPGVLGEISRRLEELGVVRRGDALLKRLLEREQLGTTALGAGVAVPHCKLDDVNSVRLAVATAPAGVDFGADDGKPVRLFFLVISPTKEPAVHLKCLAAISKWIKTQPVERIVELDDPQAIYETLRDEAPAAG